MNMKSRKKEHNRKWEQENEQVLLERGYENMDMMKQVLEHEIVQQEHNRKWTSRYDLLESDTKTWTE